MARDDEALRLRLMLEAHRLSRSDVARATGVTPGMVSHWLTGRRRPTAAAQAAIAQLIASRPLFEARS
jgi:transcriptional regulator with XRE-family HTH domain